LWQLNQKKIFIVLPEMHIVLEKKSQCLHPQQLILQDLWIVPA
jgi:hypothetical protein